MSGFVKVKTQDLSGAALDWAVGVAIGLELKVPDGFIRPYWHMGGEMYCSKFQPSTDWSQGGRLIESHQVSLHCPQTTDDVWAAWIITDKGEVVQAGDTAMIAACRAIVAAKLGDEVDVPEGLV